MGRANDAVGAADSCVQEVCVRCHLIYEVALWTGFNTFHLRLNLSSDFGLAVSEDVMGLHMYMDL
jgi:hypothetical protein